VYQEPATSSLEQEGLDGLNTRSEVKQAIHDLARNKTPGLDRIRIEYYNRFLTHLVPRLVEL
ncbi:hypothetical protein NDU88_006419, partial [Pleurodeles waltl]